MALLAINAADQTILQMYAKTANSVVSEKKKVHVPDQSKRDQLDGGDDASYNFFVGALYVSAVAEQKCDSDTNKWYKTISIGGEQIRSKLDTGGRSKRIACAYHKQNEVRNLRRR